MNLDFKQQVWGAQFRPTEESAIFEDKLRTALGLQFRYEASRLLIGRSLAEPVPPDPLPSGTKFFNKPIPGQNLLGENEDLWLSAIILDGRLGESATIDDFRTLLESHWARGYRLIKEELDSCQGNEIKLIQRLADRLPEVQTASNRSGTMDASGAAGEIRLKIGSVSKTLAGDKTVDFVINSAGVAPHIALMGKIGSGKTTTGLQIALELVGKSGIPFLFIDPKGEFVEGNKVCGKLASLNKSIGAIEVGTVPIPLDFLPPSSSPTNRIAKAAMGLRDTIALCCSNVGDLQKNLLRTVIEDVLNSGLDRSLEAIRDSYERGLLANNKSGVDSVTSRLNELTNKGMPCFEPLMSPGQFFRQSWVISLKELPEELKRLVTLLLLDTVSTFLLEQSDSDCPGGFRQLRHLLVVDEARKILREKKSESLVDLIRKGRSKGSVVMLLSQDPSDFEGQADDFLSQLGSVVAFSCNQTKSGLGSLSGVFGRKLQAAEFSDTQLDAGVAFVKLPNRHPERVRCWIPGAI
jgi:hypothetical protein